MGEETMKTLSCGAPGAHSAHTHRAWARGEYKPGVPYPTVWCPGEPVPATAPREPETVTLRCRGGCEPGSYADGPPAPQEDCPVHGRSYDDMWMLRSAYDEALRDSEHGSEIRERALLIYQGKYEQERDRAYHEGEPHG